MNRFNYLYDAGAVKRFHTKRTIQEQTVAEHSWGVAVILLEICIPSPALMRAALYHDLAEVETGDVPAPAKWDSTPLRDSLQTLEDRFNLDMRLSVELTYDEVQLLKWADMLELIMYCRSEVELGNTKMVGIMSTGIAYLAARKSPSVAASKLLERLSV